VPRRTYTQSHIDYVVEVVLELKEKADELRGFRIVEEPGELRHFTARLRPCSSGASCKGAEVHA